METISDSWFRYCLYCKCIKFLNFRTNTFFYDLHDSLQFSCSKSLYTISTLRNWSEYSSTESAGMLHYSMGYTSCHVFATERRCGLTARQRRRGPRIPTLCERVERGAGSQAALQFDGRRKAGPESSAGTGSNYSWGARDRRREGGWWHALEGRRRAVCVET